MTPGIETKIQHSFELTRIGTLLGTQSIILEIFKYAMKSMESKDDFCSLKGCEQLSILHPKQMES